MTRKYRKLWQLLELILSFSRALANRRARKWFAKNLGKLSIGLTHGASPRISWSQHGEDVALESLLPGRGYYVDVGAHHPFRHSVTQRLYEKGWKGLNVDIAPAIADLFPKYRPRDINVQAIVSSSADQLEVIHFTNNEVTTVEQAHAALSLAAGQEVLFVETVTPRSLNDLMSQFHKELPRIDLLSIDTEGHDFEVLDSIDLERFEVHAVLIEESRELPQVVARIQSRLEAAGFTKQMAFSESSFYVKI